MGQPDSKLPGAGEDDSHPLVDRDDQEHAKYAFDRVFEHRGTGIQTRYEVRWWLESSLELIHFIAL